MTTQTSDLSRLTIVSPNTRVDLSIPSDVPFAEMLPTMLRQLGSSTPDDAVARGGWVLTRLDGDHLDTGKSPLQLAVRDGEVLYLTNAQTATPEMVFDDVVEAVATSTGNRGFRWDFRDTRILCLTLTAGALSLGVPVVALSGPPFLVSALAALVMAGILISVAAAMSRVYAEPRAAMVFSVPAIGYGAAAGLTILYDAPGVSLWHPAHVLLAGCGLLLFATAALAAVPQSAPFMFAVLIASAALVVGAGLSLLLGMPATAGAAIVIPLALLFMPSLPMHAMRLAKMPIPSLPTTVEELKGDTHAVDGNRILAVAERSHVFLSALLGALSAICGAAAIVAAFGGGLPGMLLCVVLSLVLFLRVRPVLSRAPRIPVIVAGSAGMVAVAIAGFAAGNQLVRLLLVLGGLVLVAVIVTVYGLVITGRRISPVWGRVLDIIEILLIVAVIPLAAWTSGVFGWLLAWAG